MATAAKKKAVSQQKLVSEIQITGNKNIETDTIKGNIITQVGSAYSQDSVREDILKLFQMGYFYNIEVDKKSKGDGWLLTYKVTEKPPITEIFFDGNSDVSEDDLREAIGLKTYTILSQGKIQSAIDKMLKVYEEKGFFLAKIKFELKFTDQKQETYALHFLIEENDKVMVKKIRIVGSKNIGEATLKGRLQTQEGGFFSFLGSSGSFKQENLERDAQIILHSYYSEGYVNAKVDPALIYVTPDKKSIYITFHVEEGLQYDVGQIDFSGDILFPEEELREAIQSDDRKVFSVLVMQNDISSLQAKYGDLGYAFANIIPRTQIIEEERKVNITFDFDKGEKVYFGKFTVVGNDKTRDKVVRRELKITEGELYNETRKRESLANIKRLGYFDEVNFKTSTPANQPTILDIEIQVKEKNTGSIQVGAGYSSYQGFVLNGQINQANLFGYGQKLGLNVNYSDKEKTVSLNFTEPYLNDSKWSLGFEIYVQDEERTDFEQEKTGAAIRIGHPITDYLSGFLRYRLDDTDLKLDDENGDPDLFPVDTVNGITSSVTATLEYDKRDDRLTPTDGAYASASYEYAGLGGDKYFSKTNLNFRYYHKVFWELVWRNNIAYRFLDSINGKDLPFSELFLLGGAYNMRGFRNFSVGRKKYSVAKGEDRPFGGEKAFYYNLEFEFPLIPEASIRGVVFYDIGNAQDEIDFNDLRSNYGFGFRWLTPFGPLRFEWGFPVDRNEDLGEAPYNFEFSIGSPF
ncbi:MAG: outer membrane protein assembly factor BamA [Bdellovibrionales bacterium]|nr:outer membrane protein assembly factor BamA [Bdellovibrionales bacterium]